MADELIGLTLLAAADAVTTKGAKRYRLIRLLRALAGSLFCLLIGVAVALSFIYA